MYENLAILAIFIFLYSLFAGGLERTPINGAVVFTAFGVIVGPLMLGWLQLDLDAEMLRTLAELTLALLLFSDAANANLDVLKQNIRFPKRLLLVGLPITIVLGFGFGMLLFDTLTLFEIAILATMLAPTDAALGKAVVSNPSVPENIRESLNFESGLNDGICVPILFVFLALATNSGGGEGAHILAIELVAEEIGIGAIVGITLTAAAVWLMRQCKARDWITETWKQLPVVVLSVSCFSIAQVIGGSGFIAAFVGGILFGALAKEHKHHFLLAAEGTGDTLALLTWVIFGAIVVGHSIDTVSWEIVLYAVLSLTVIRMLPVFFALGGLNLRPSEKLFMGWFGPRGLASIVFAVIVLNENLPGGDIISMTVVSTVVLSILLHGISANFLVKRLVKRIQET
ncbi:MAG: cation:proton antiporter [Gammaproteobacteria bacterium]|nr:cation:proton antiporter [Gammaproteobacteria bacterium]